MAPNASDWREMKDVFADVAIFGTGEVDVSGTESPETVGISRVSPEYFATLGLQPVLGRMFRLQDHTPGAPLVLLLSHSLWQKRFGGDVLCRRPQKTAGAPRSRTMSNNDAPIGRLLSRREILALAGVSSVALMAQAWRPDRLSAFVPNSDVPSCVVRPEQTEGPYFVDERLNRADIRTDPGSGEVKSGTPLDLTIRVSQVVLGRCTPLSGALVDVWHCDALGVYSDVDDPAFSTIGKKFLRGYQVTDTSGKVRFTTIYPGWYGTRAVHIHFKVRTSAASARAHEFVSQMYFPDSLSDRVHARPPYASKGMRHVRNQNDRIFRDGGERLLLDVVQRSGGYAATFDIALATA